jgi:glycosyltransferase involved in cell wall biosynthesis
MNEPPYITVLLASFNRLEFLEEAVESVLAQKCQDSFEVLVVDDGSEAETRNWLDHKARNNPLLRVVHQAHAGVASARYHGLVAARGEWVAILDSDDLLLPGALEVLAKALHSRPDVDLFYADVLDISRHGKPSGRVRYPRFANNDRMMRSVFVRPRVPFKHSGTTFRPATALELGGYDVDLPFKIDVDLFLRFLSAGKRLYHIDEPLAAFRRHRKSISNSRRIEGIRVWSFLIDRYRGNTLEARIYKVFRGSVEYAKHVYATVFFG